MKTSKVITLMMVGLALSFSPALAQRGGTRSGGGSRGGSVSAPSRSSGSSMRSSSGSSSRSSSFSSPRSSSSSRSSVSTPRSSSPSRSSVSSPRSASPSRGNVSSPRSSSSSRSSVGTPRGTDRSTLRSSGAREAGRGTMRGTDRRNAGAVAPVRGGGHGDVRGAAPSTSSHGAPVHRSANPGDRNYGYDRPGHPGPMPPSHRPIHPAPYFYHPWFGYHVHCHPLFWDPLPLRPWYWPGFWLYCNSYWYDYHVTDVVVVRDYVKQTYSVDMITYGISGDIMYAIVRDDGTTYLQVYDKDDHLLAEQKIHKKYCNMVIDPDNGGCWISKKHEKDPLLFIWADGQLLIYEAD